MKVIPTEKIMSSRFTELSIVKSSKAPTRRASYRCLMTDNPVVPRTVFEGLRRTQNSIVNVKR